MKSKTDRNSVVRGIFLVVILLLVICGNGAAQTFTVLVNFNGTNGSQPTFGSLTVDSQGNLWGATKFGGTNNLGTIFKMTPVGVLTTVYNFGSTPGDSMYPYSPPIVGTDGNLYGTAGGDSVAVSGIVYKLTPSGTLTVLHTFELTDGGYNTYPAYPLTQGTDGNFYGVTYNYGYGTVFTITPDGTFTNLYTFSGPDGRAPFGSLVQGTDGYFYGTTAWGGAYDAGGETGGTIYKISSTGSFTSLYSFGADEGNLFGGLIQAKDGNFYGVTALGGTNVCPGINTCGTIFKMTPSGTVSTLASFSVSDGYDVNGPVLQASDGNFYGTSYAGGEYGFGTIYQMTPAGTLTVLHDFTSADGTSGEGGLVQHPNGQLYGFQHVGGSNGDGTVYTITLGGPAVNLSAPSLSFGNEILGSTSSTQTVTLTNTGVAPLDITSIAASGDFSQTNTCGTSVNAGANCAINVTFTPTVAGTRSGTITITDNAPNSPQTVSLTGTGINPAVALVMGPQAMEGNLQLNPGTTLMAGYDFTMPGTHPSAAVSFIGAEVTFAWTCVSGTGSGALVVPMADQTYTDAQNSSAWYPSGDQHSSLVYQGSIAVPDVCSGTLVSFQAGGTFSTEISSTDTKDKVNVRWHYSGNGSAGGWSGTQSVVP